MNPSSSNRMWISPISSPVIFFFNISSHVYLLEYFTFRYTLKTSMQRNECPSSSSSRKSNRGHPEWQKKRASLFPLHLHLHPKRGVDGSTAMKKIPRSTKSNRAKRALEIAELAKLGIKTKARNEYGKFCKVCGQSQLIHPYFAPYLGSRYCPTVNTNISWKDWKKEKKAAASNEN